MCLLCEELWMAFEPAPQPDRQAFIADAPQPNDANGAPRHDKPAEQQAEDMTGQTAKPAH
jgi:hypothetical protein